MVQKRGLLYWPQLNWSKIEIWRFSVGSCASVRLSPRIDLWLLLILIRVWNCWMDDIHLHVLSDMKRDKPNLPARPRMTAWPLFNVGQFAFYQMLSFVFIRNNHFRGHESIQQTIRSGQFSLILTDANWFENIPFPWCSVQRSNMFCPCYPAHRRDCQRNGVDVVVIDYSYCYVWTLFRCRKFGLTLDLDLFGYFVRIWNNTAVRQAWQIRNIHGQSTYSYVIRPNWLAAHYAKVKSKMNGEKKKRK